MSTSWLPREGPPPVWVDFNRGGGDVVWLDLQGTQHDLERLGLTLEEGVTLNVWDEDADDSGARDDLIATGVVECGARWDDGWQLRIIRWGHSSSY